LNGIVHLSDISNKQFEWKVLKLTIKSWVDDIYGP